MVARRFLAISRDRFLFSRMGLTGLALTAMLQRDGFAQRPGNTVRDRGTPHFACKAKRIIWLMMRGGVSHLESFAPKLLLAGMQAGRSVRHRSRIRY